MPTLLSNGKSQELKIPVQLLNYLLTELFTNTFMTPHQLSLNTQGWD